jgi:hypothetical protein
MSEMVERAAEAICDAEFGPGMWAIPAHEQKFRDLYRVRARAAIEAMREPTDDMVDEGWRAKRAEIHDTAPEPRDAYRAMIDAALEE